jgi:hypothetical protein
LTGIAARRFSGDVALARAVQLEPVSLREIVGEGVRWAAGTDRDTLGTGIDHFDRALGGGLPTGVLCEFVASAPSSGGQTVLLHLLEEARKERRFAALVDGANAFDPQTAPPALIEHLLWVRCRSVEQALRAADVLLRDENLGMVIVDLRDCAGWALKRTRSTVWYRLQRLAGRWEGTLVVFTPRPMIPSAQIRVAFAGRLSAVQCDANLAEVARGLEFDVLRLRKQEMGDFPQLIQAG